MTARLRSMTVSKDVTILVLDGLGRITIDPVEQARFTETAKLAGASGGILFGQQVDLPHEDPQPEAAPTRLSVGQRHVFADTNVLDALQWAIQALDIMPIGDDLGELNPLSDPARNIATLHRLLDDLSP